jgi:hypothetical protein
MMIFKKALPRRTFLRGAGIALGLPLLDSMIPAMANAAANPAKPPLRISWIYWPNGIILNKWTPKAEGTGYEITPSLQPLAAYRDRMLLVSGLNIKCADGRPGEGGSGHARSGASYLTGIHPAPDGALGTSVDQLFAREFGKETQLGSLEIGMESPEIAGKADGNYRDSYTKTICWRTGVQPLPMENNPRKVFERLLGDSGSTDSAVRLREARKNRSILDFINGEAARVSQLLGNADRVKLGEYMEAVRDIERRIHLAEEQAGRQLPNIERPTGINGKYSDQARLMFDLQLLALQADLTRVCTFMLGLESGEGDYREIGITEGHHALSHHGGYSPSIASCERIDLFHSELVAGFVSKLQSTPEGDGSLLDHTLLINGAGLDDGMMHTHNGVPVMLMGATGRIQKGRHIRFNGDPLTNLWVTILEMTKIPYADWRSHKESDATGPLEGIVI